MDTHFRAKIKGKAAGKKRPMQTKYGHRFQCPDERKYCNEIKMVFARLMLDHPRYTGALSVRLDMYYKKPKTVKRKNYTVKPDIDNCAKLILDCGNKIVWVDDAQIVKLELSQKYSETDYDWFVIVVKDVEIHG